VEDSINHSEELADNSIAEMFEYLEKRYKQEKVKPTEQTPPKKLEEV
jgi:hypothetical protein